MPRRGREFEVLAATLGNISTLEKFYIEGILRENVPGAVVPWSWPHKLRVEPFGELPLSTANNF